MASLKVTDSSEYLAITGWGIDDVKVAKKAWVWIGQQHKKFDTTPVNYTFEVQAMSAENLPLVLPAVFTIGPCADEAFLLRYARLVSSLHKDSLFPNVNELVKGVIEGETRVLAASMTVEEIFRGESFKQALFEKVQRDLNQFGLIIYDVPGHEEMAWINAAAASCMQPNNIDIWSKSVDNAEWSSDRSSFMLTETEQLTTVQDSKLDEHVKAAEVAEGSGGPGNRTCTASTALGMGSTPAWIFLWHVRI